MNRRQFLTRLIGLAAVPLVRLTKKNQPAPQILEIGRPSPYFRYVTFPDQQDLHLSQEALEDVRAWTNVTLTEAERREIFLNGPTRTI